MERLGSGAKATRYAIDTFVQGRVTELHGQLGRLNMLTPARTAAAAALVQTGEVVSLK